MRGSFIIAFIALLGATLILVFTFFRPEAPGRRVPPVPPVPNKIVAANKAPKKPVAAAAEPAAIAPSFDVVRISRNCTAVIAGRSAAGALVIVKAGTHELGRVTADAQGEWVLVPDLPLKGGTQQLTLQATANGKAPVISPETVTVVVPDCRPGQPYQGEEAVAVLTPNKGFSRLLQVPGRVGEKSGKTGLSLDTIDYDDKGDLALSGHAAAGSTVQIYLNNQPIGTAKANSSGEWYLALGKKVAPGVYTLRVDQVAETGKVIARIETPFSRAKPSDIHVAEGQVVVQPGNSLWRIARRTYGHGLQYTVIYQANKEQIRNPNLIYPGQVFVMPHAAASSAAGTGAPATDAPATGASTPSAPPATPAPPAAVNPAAPPPSAAPTPSAAKPATPVPAPAGK